MIIQIQKNKELVHVNELNAQIHFSGIIKNVLNVLDKLQIQLSN